MDHEEGIITSAILTKNGVRSGPGTLEPTNALGPQSCRNDLRLLPTARARRATRALRAAMAFAPAVLDELRDLLADLSVTEVREFCIDALRTWRVRHPDERRLAMHDGFDHGSPGLHGLETNHTVRVVAPRPTHGGQAQRGCLTPSDLDRIPWSERSFTLLHGDRN